jgi:hypothetical protein
MPQQVITTTGSGSFIVPADVYWIDQVELRGGGGGGCVNTNGGGAGAYIKVRQISVNPGDTVNYIIATGGGGGNYGGSVAAVGTGYKNGGAASQGGGYNGGAGGGSSSVVFGSTTYIASGGGGGGNAPGHGATGSSGGAGGGGSGFIQGGGGGSGTVGGNGTGSAGGPGGTGGTTQTGTNGNGSSGGGSSAGASGNGNNGTSTVGGAGSGGAAGGTYGNPGGAGASGTGADSGGGGGASNGTGGGGNGGQPGAGGGAGSVDGSSSGTGGAGQLILTYSNNNIPPIAISDSTTMSDSVNLEIIDQGTKVSDTTVVTDAVKLLRIDYSIVKSETTVVTDSVQMQDLNIVNGTDLLVSLVVSGYKWLTQTLYNAQQQFTTRPWFTAKIIDDSIDPTGIVETSVAPYSWGSAAPTPDGNIVAAGFGVGTSPYNINFYKGRNLAGGWGSTYNFDSGNQLFPSNGQTNQVQIAVSDYYKGSYRIDVAYLTNFTGSLGSYLILQLWSSNDGGVTWSNTPITLTDLPYNSLPANLYIALMKPRLINGVMTSGYIYLSPTGNTLASGYPAYNLKYSINPSGTITTWAGVVNSQDWTIHSFDSFYLNGIDYVVFSGFRNIVDNPTPKATNQNPNYELWITGIRRRATNAVAAQVWLPPTPIFPANANTPNNQNQYTFPKATVQNGFVDIVFQSITTSSISITAAANNSVTVGTTQQTMHTRSQDGLNFSYPDILVDSNGNYILPSNINNQLQSFVLQDSFYYLCGGNQIYQFIQNNVVADISADVIGYTITETAGQANSISLQIANQNNKWFGGIPTEPGASAITGNSKIVVQQGFYNSAGVPEVAPRSIFFLDDSQASVTGTNNDLTIVGRDWFKKLLVLTTRFALQWIGPFFYSDVFDGSTLSNWNQVSGTWSESNNQLVPLATTGSVDSIALLTGIQQITYGSIMVVNIGPVGTHDQAGGSIYIAYWDATHWIRIDIAYEIGGGQVMWQFVVNDGTGPFGIANGTLPITAANWVSGNCGFVVRQYDYYKINIYWSNLVTSVVSNPLTMWYSCRLISGEVDLTSLFFSIPVFQNPWSVGLGTTPGIQGGTTVTSIPFSYFRYTQLGKNNNILSISEAIATEAGIFTKFNSPPVIPNTTQSIIAEQQFTELMFNPNFSGNFSILNRTLIVPSGLACLNVDSDKQIGNGQIVFWAKVTMSQAASKCGFTFTFRGTGQVECYTFRVNQYSPGTGFSGCRFGRIHGSTQTAVWPNSPDDDNTIINPTYGSLGIDITQYHKYEIIMSDGWMYAFIDDAMVAAWNDNNTDTPILTTGYWGFISDANSTLYVQNITSPQFWKTVPAFSLNPGDDAENAVLQLVQQVRGWTFSDLLGRMKYIQLLTTDQPNFTYDNQIVAQATDNSDKEYISQVTVYGTGVMATAVNTSLMAGTPVRDAVIVDYTITTQNDAQIRANLELLNFNQYINQNEPTQVINPGSELFDVITVINTGNNTSGVDAPSRIYSQTFTQGGGTTTSDYSIQISTGVV